MAVQSHPEGKHGGIEAPEDGSPLVSVIIAVFNDELHIADAIGSVLEQTLNGLEVVVVDDASTDGTRAVVEDLVARDSRVRYLPLTENTGGAGAPRNRGLDLARGRYVTFLDSDDKLERHACINLVRAAEVDGSDVVMGRTARLDVAKQTRSGWHNYLFAERRYVESIEDFPELGVDTTIAKLCRLSFLNENSLRYPEDIHYEDLVFAADILRFAHGISVIPENTYIWHVYPTTVRKSITHQRDSISNVDSRLAALNLILSRVTTDRWPRLHEVLQEKVLVHDARLYLNDIADSDDDEYARLVLSRLKPLLEGVPREVTERLEVQRRLMASAAISGDPATVREAMAMMRRQSDLVGEVETVDGRYVWQAEAVRSEPTGRALELATFEQQELGQVTWFGYKFDHALGGLSLSKGGKLKLRGSTQDQINKLGGVPGLKWTARLYERNGLERSWGFPVEVSFNEESGAWDWAVELSMPRHADLTVLPRLTLRLDLESHGVRNTGGVRIARKFKSAKYRRPSGGLVSRLFGARYEPYKTIQNTLAFRVAAVQSKRKALRTILRPVWAVNRWLLSTSWVQLESHKGFAFNVAYRALRSLPIKRDVVFVDSHMGGSNFDSPMVIARELELAHPELTIIRATAKERPVWEASTPNTVRIGTWQHLKVLATAGYLIDNQSLPWYYTKRAGQVYVQTWHGIPLKRMGLDVADVAGDPKKVKDLKRRSSFWDYLTIPSAFFSEVFVPAFDYRHAQLPPGSPRNDVLVHTGDFERQQAKKILGLDPDLPAILYAPTFREDARGAIPLELDLDEWVGEFGGRAQLLVRPHYLNRISVPRIHRGAVVDVSAVKDTSLVMQAADVLVTDYSSVMFDYLTLDRPIVLYVYDLDDYMGAARGTYFDLREHAPGALVFDQEQLSAAVNASLRTDAYAAERLIFKERFAGEEPGDAAEKTVNVVWGDK